MTFVSLIPSTPIGRNLFEVSIWIVGLLAVGLADPYAESLIDLCLFKAIGIPRCPGRGLGHAMGFLFRGEWSLAVNSHIFSPVVALFLTHRIGSLLRSAWTDKTL